MYIIYLNALNFTIVIGKYRRIGFFLEVIRCWNETEKRLRKISRQNSSNCGHRTLKIYKEYCKTAGKEPCIT